MLTMRELNQKSRFGLASNPIIEVEATREPSVESRFIRDSSQAPPGPPKPHPSGKHESNALMAEIVDELVECGFDPAEAQQLVLESAKPLAEDQRENRLQLWETLLKALAEKLRTGGAIDPATQDPKVLAFVGPTGVGKTTTIAKIASHLSSTSDCQVGFIACDTVRPGAVDQLLHFADRLSAPLEVISSPAQVAPALKRLRGCKCVLIDTAGHSHRNASQLNLQRELLSIGKPDATLLVLSAASSARFASQILHAYTVLAPDSLVITKTDESVDFGSWLPVLRESDLRVSYLTHGQQVAHDLTIADNPQLAALLTGRTVKLDKR